MREAAERGRSEPFKDSGRPYIQITHTAKKIQEHHEEGPQLLEAPF